jgi:TolB-like protein
VRQAAVADSAPTVAVLPFDHVGDSADAYFADGLADEVRAKLAALPALRVIATASSNGYRRTTKPQAQVARELGAQYLLAGRVRWDKAGGARGRVRVHPELVQLSAAGVPTVRWSEPVEAELSDVFRVQTEVAAKVADALGVALAPQHAGRLGDAPTRSLDAYDAYLRARAAAPMSGADASSAPALRAAVALYERAVALDSTFALAWAGLTPALTTLYNVTAPDPAIPEWARRAAERALALGPALPEAHFAQAAYAYGVLRDGARARAAVEAGLRVAPSDPRLLSAAGFYAFSVGRGDEALARLRAAAALDPRSEPALQALGLTALHLRRTAEARAAFERALALAHAHAVRGGLGAARAYADSARLAAEGALRAGPDDAYTRTLLGAAPGQPALPAARPRPAGPARRAAPAARSPPRAPRSTRRPAWTAGRG